MNRHIFIASLLCSLCFIMIGYDNGVIGGLTGADSFNKTFGYPNASLLGTIAAVYELGAFVGSLLTVAFGERFGRKKILGAGAVLMIVFAGAVQASSYTVAQLIVSRLLGGIGMGMINSTAPVLQSEVAPKGSRGTYISANTTVLSFGMSLAYWIDFGFVNHFTGSVSFRFPLAMQLVFSCTILFLTFICVESPRWLANHDRHAEGLNVVAKLMGLPESDPAVKERYEEIADAVLYEKTVQAKGWADIFKKDELGSRHRLWIACSIQGLQQLGGNNAVNYYGQYVFANSLGFSPYMAGLMSGFCFTWFFLSSFVPWYALDRWGRKPLIMGSTLFMACLFAILSGVIHQVQYNAPNAYACGIVAAICVFLYLSAFAIGYQATVWCLTAEILPLRIRAKGTALATSTNWILNFAVVEFFPPAIANIGWKVYIIFMLLNLLAIPICHFTYVETKGKSLEDIDLLFGHHHFVDIHQAKQEVVGKDDSSSVINEKMDSHSVSVVPAA